MADAPLTDAELAAIEARANAATDGPWGYEEDNQVWMLFGGGALMPLQLLKAPKRDTPYAEYWPSPVDAEFIAHARTDVSRLCAEVRRLRAAVMEQRPDTYTCSICGGSFELSPSATRQPRTGARRFCSEDCRRAARREVNRAAWHRNKGRWRPPAT